MSACNSPATPGDCDETNPKIHSQELESCGDRLRQQRIGRLLRPAKGKRAVIYERVVVGTHEVQKASERRRALQAPERGARG